ncbi:ferredoxin [Amycolatopsis alkalitolerans]|uniref:Ferredoxin n=1 Tax=Amycolatopsis alkalitolerans TaxID=2547244 RepID=A0A5C4MAH5_9PSEU|nr:ferredoxin [Amycolatopsis alkalitolerans]TNC29229.1 ferredoxin [Amycolatopsis alkalitolerans]
MKIAVDLTKCQNHGQCTYSASEVFSLDDNGELSFRAVAKDEYVSGELPGSVAEDVEEAIDVCPVQAIRQVD